MIFDSFKKDYEEQEREILALISDGGGSGVKSDTFWVAQMYFLAYVDVKTNELKNGEGRLVWPLTEKEEESRSYFHRFKKETIYRIKAHELINKTVPAGRTPSFYNKFYVTEILEEGATHPELEEILAEYKKPVIIQDDTLGELILDKHLALFDGQTMWMGNNIRIHLDVNIDNKATWTKARKAMKQLVAEQEKWDKAMREFSAAELISLANDWQQEEDEETPVITKEDFSKRITLQSISVTSGGSFNAYYDDDDMFWGHVIGVDGTLKKGMKSANIEG